MVVVLRVAAFVLFILAAIFSAPNWPHVCLAAGLAAWQLAELVPGWDLTARR